MGASRRSHGSVIAISRGQRLWLQRRRAGRQRRRGADPLPRFWVEAPAEVGSCQHLSSGDFQWFSGASAFAAQALTFYTLHLGFQMVANSPVAIVTIRLIPVCE